VNGTKKGNLYLRGRRWKGINPPPGRKRDKVTLPPGDRR